MKRIGNKGLRLIRVNVKQSHEIEKVYETIGSEISDDSTNHHVGIMKIWTPQVIPPEASSIQKQDDQNQENTFHPSRKSPEWKTVPPLSTEKKKSTINPKEIESKTMKKGDKMSKRYENEELNESDKSLERMKKERISKTRAAKQRNILEGMNSNKSNFSQSVTKSGGFSSKSMKKKSNQKYNIAIGKTKKTGTKKVQNFQVNEKLKYEKGKLITDDRHKIKTTKAMTDKVKTSKEDLNLRHLNNKSHYKLGTLGATEKPKRKTDNIRKENRRIKTTLRKAYSLRNTKITIQGNNTLKPCQDKRNVLADMNVANIVNSFIRLPLQVQRRVIDEVLSRQHNFKRISETNRTTSRALSTTSAVLSEKYGTTSVLPKVYSTASVLPKAHSTTSVLPKAYITASTDFPEAYTAMSVDLSEAYNTMSVDLSETNSITSGDFSEDYSITSVDFPEGYSTPSVDFSEDHSIKSLDLPEGYSTPSVDPTGNNPEVLTFEENVSQPYENGSSPKTSEEAKFNSIMLKEFSEIYSIPPPSSRDFPSVSEEKSVKRRSSNQNQNRQNFFPHQEGRIPRIRTKKNKGYFPKNDVADIAGTLYNYFARVPQNQKRGIQEDIPRKLNTFFDKISKHSTMKSTRDLKNILTPVLVTVKPRETDSEVDYDQIRMREFYYGDYDETTENDVMDTLGDLSEEFAT